MATFPGRVQFRSSAFEGEAELLLQLGNMHMRIYSDRFDSSTPELISVATQILGPIVNLVAFRLCASFRVLFDHIIRHATGQSELVSVVEPIFSGPVAEKFTFQPFSENVEHDIPIELISDPKIQTALEELSLAIQRASFTPMHCYLALESLKELHEGTDEKARWISMHTKLNISLTALESIASIAKNQKHGKNVDLISWDVRKRCLQVSWEVLNRQMLAMKNAGQSFLPLE